MIASLATALYFPIIVSLSQLTGASLTTSKGRPALLVIDPFIDFLHNPLLQLCEERGIRVFDAVSGTLKFYVLQLQCIL